MKRVVFFSKHDASWHLNLELAEKLLINFENRKAPDLNALLEFYHIRLYFKHELYLPRWDKLTRKEFTEKIETAYTSLKKRLLSLDEAALVAEIPNLEYNYCESFWEVLNNIKGYSKITEHGFVSILNKFPQQIYDVLLCKSLVHHFDKEIAGFLKQYSKAAELILQRFEQKHDYATPEYIFPNSLSLKDKEEILSKYIDSDIANLNYIRLIENSKASPILRISDKVRLKAKRKSSELNNKILEDSHSRKYGISVTIDKDQTEPVKYSTNHSDFNVTYSEPFLENLLTNNISLFHCFSRLFHFTDELSMVKLVNKNAEMDVLERTLMMSKHEYSNSFSFQRKNRIALAQLLIFKHYLEQNGNSIEAVIDAFVSYLVARFDLKNFHINLPTKSAHYLEKSRIIAPEIESILRQYQFFVEDGNIDIELLKINSSPIFFGEIKSRISRKYLYENSGEVSKLKFLFFSDQSPVHYVKSYKERKNLFEILVNEDIRLNEFLDFQQDFLNELIEQGHLFIDSEKFVRIVDLLLIELLGKLHTDSVISYWHYAEIVQIRIDAMVNAGWLSFDSSLFTKEEVAYFNYYLNKKDFTNGYDLRNKYLHGTNSNDEKTNELDYCYFLKLLILALIKIEDDLILESIASSKSV